VKEPSRSRSIDVPGSLSEYEDFSGIDVVLLSVLNEDGIARRDLLDTENIGVGTLAEFSGTPPGEKTPLDTKRMVENIIRVSGDFLSSE